MSDKPPKPLTLQEFTERVIDEATFNAGKWSGWRECALAFAKFINAQPEAQPPEKDAPQDASQ